MRAGASRDAAKRIIKKIRGQIYRGVDTHDIYKMVLLALGEEQDGAVLKQKYQLKEAIMRLETFWISSLRTLLVKFSSV